jgi:GLPGLI family protein
MKKILIYIVLVLGSQSIYAQTQFVNKGKIEFEKRVNLHNNMDQSSWSDMLKKTVPKVKLSYYNMYFDNNKVLYRPGREVTDAIRIPDWILGPSIDNVIYSDIDNGTMVAQKAVFETNYLIMDSLRKAEWRITNDTRTIAGFNCRKATTIIMDSIFVVAFYTDQIITPGGPESFSGLPGMILGLAIPRIYTTWYATKLWLVPVKPEELEMPKKGKKINNTQLQDQLKTVMKDWGTNGQRNIWQIML